MRARRTSSAALRLLPHSLLKKHSKQVVHITTARAESASIVRSKRTMRIFSRGAALGRLHVGCMTNLIVDLLLALVGERLIRL